MELIDIDNYIFENWKLYTLKQIADFVGREPFVIKYRFGLLGLTPKKIEDIRTDYIIAHPELSNEELAENMKTNVDTILRIKSALKVKKTGSFKKPQDTLRELEKKLDPDYFAFLDRFADEVLKHGINNTFSKLDRKMAVPADRPKAVYSQSGSPYGIADEFRNITIKK